MARYSLFRWEKDAPEYLMAVYEKESPGIVFTTKREDACQYATMDKAVDIAKQLKSLHGFEIFIGVDDE